MLNNVRRPALSLAILLVLCSCQTLQPPSHLPSKYVLPSQMPSGAEAVSEEFILMADNQTSNVYSMPVQGFRTLLMDQAVNVAIRPIQVDYFGPYLITDVVFPIADKRPILHLGDAANFSCTGEFLKFLGVMGRHKGQWFMTPGNHDVAFLGNAIIEYRFFTDAWWEEACKCPGETCADERMPKDKFIPLYLASLALRNEEAYQEFRQSQMPLLVGETDIQQAAAIIGNSYSAGEHTFPDGDPTVPLRAIKWEINNSKPWKSYIVQRIDMGCNGALKRGTDGEKQSCAQAILFDTTQYDQPLLFTAVTADVGAEQFDVVENKWLMGSSASNTLTIFMGHHPYNKLTKDAKYKLDDLRRRFNVLAYVSADTHQGQYIVHGGADDAWLELNLGSLIDWPAEIRKLRVYRVGDKTMLYAPRINISEELGKHLPAYPQVQEWEAAPYGKDAYLLHRNTKSLKAELESVPLEMRIKNALLITHRKLISLFPTEELNGYCPVDGVSSARECDAQAMEEIQRVIDHCDPEHDKNGWAQLRCKCRFLDKLEKFDQQRYVAEEQKKELMDFRLSQIYWGSKYEALGERKPGVDDSYIVVPQTVR
jgi:hypothetical protein